MPAPDYNGGIGAMPHSGIQGHSPGQAVGEANPPGFGAMLQPVNNCRIYYYY